MYFLNMLALSLFNIYYINIIITLYNNNLLKLYKKFGCLKSSKHKNVYHNILTVDVILRRRSLQSQNSSWVKIKSKTMTI